MTRSPELLTRKDRDRGLMPMILASAFVHVLIMLAILYFPRPPREAPPAAVSYTVDLVSASNVGGTNLPAGGNGRDRAAPIEAPPAPAEPPVEMPPPPAPPAAIPPPAPAAPAEVAPPPPAEPAPAEAAQPDKPVPPPAPPEEPQAAEPPAPPPRQEPEKLPAVEVAAAKSESAEKKAEPPKPKAEERKDDERPEPQRARATEAPKPKASPAKKPEEKKPEEKLARAVAKPSPAAIPATPEAPRKAEEPKAAPTPVVPAAASAAPSPASPPTPNAAAQTAQATAPDVAALSPEKMAEVRDRAIAAAIGRHAKNTEGGEGPGGPAAAPAGDAGTGPLSIGPGEGSGGTPQSAEYILYYNALRERLKSKWAWAGSNSALQAVVHFNVAPTGEIFNVYVVKPSGDASFDRSAERAVRGSSPLPPPPERHREDFSEVEMTFLASDLNP